MVQIGSCWRKLHILHLVDVIVNHSQKVILLLGNHLNLDDEVSIPK